MVFMVFPFYKRDLWLMFSLILFCHISLWADFCNVCIFG